MDTLTVNAHRPDNDEVVKLTFTNLRLFSYGVYANVYIGELVENGKSQAIAVKKCWSHTEDIREVRILKMLNKNRPKNIVNLLYMFQTRYADKYCSSLVMNFMPMSLSAYIKQRRPNPLDMVDAKLFGWQVFRGVQYLHKFKIIHRDLKPQNILLEPESGLIQVADFGSSAISGEQPNMSSYHVTRYYRPPELLLGSHHYSSEIDIWSAGCVFGEMLRGRTFLAGVTTNDQFYKIVAMFGLPTESDLLNMRVKKHKLLDDEKSLVAAQKFSDNNRATMALLCPKAPSRGLHLLSQIMVYNPHNRLTGPKLLGDKFFEEIFDPATYRNGKPITVVNRSDLAQAVSGDLSHEEMESQTGGSSGAA